MSINTRDDDNSTEKPKRAPRLGSYVYLLSVMATVGGFLFGYDTGIVSAALLLIQHDEELKDMDKFWKQLIVAITPGFAAIGSLLAASFSDRFGRRVMILMSSAIFAIGAIICSIGILKEILVTGRALLGIAIGFASMVVPIYISEASPTHIRGTLLIAFQLMITFGLMASNLIAGALSYLSSEAVAWRLMFGFAAIPALVQLVGFIFLPESPRWLYQKSGRTASTTVLALIYNGDQCWIRYALNEIRIAHERYLCGLNEGKSILRRILSNPYILKALMIGCTLQAFQQLSGINTVMYYTSEILKFSGVSHTSKTIWISAGVSAVNFVCTFFPLLMIDRIGRRKLLSTSVIGVAISLFLLSGSFILINKSTVKSHKRNDLELVTGINSENFEKCIGQSNCDDCTTYEACGFCEFKMNETKTGYCLPLSEESKCNNASNASVPRTNNEGWSTSICETRYSYIPIILIVVYLCAFSIGYAPLPWVLNAEFYPLWARSTCVSISTSVNWIFNFIVAISFLTLTELAKKYGAFLVYAVITVIAFIFFYIFVPETCGCSVDEVQDLFMNKSERKKRADEEKMATNNFQSLNGSEKNPYNVFNK